MDFGGYPALKAQRSDHSLPFRNDSVDTQGTVKRGRPPSPVRGERENPQMALKFDHGTRLGLEGSVSGTPMFLKAVAFLPLLSLRGCVQGDLSQMIKLLFGLDGGNRRRGERSPGSLKLRVKLLQKDALLIATVCIAIF